MRTGFAIDVRKWSYYDLKYVDVVCTASVSIYVDKIINMIYIDSTRRFLSLKCHNSISDIVSVNFETVIQYPCRVVVAVIGVHGPLTRYVEFRAAHAPGKPGTFSPPPLVSDPDMHHGTCLTHVPGCMPGSLTSGFLWSRWHGKRSRHSQRMRNPRFYESGERPMEHWFDRTAVVGNDPYMRWNGEQWLWSACMICHCQHAWWTHTEVLNQFAGKMLWKLMEANQNAEYFSNGEYHMLYWGPFL